MKLSLTLAVVSCVAVVVACSSTNGSPNPALDGGDADVKTKALGADSSLVDQCKSKLTAKQAACAKSNGSRQCEYLEYAKLCSVGDPAAIMHVFDCFQKDECWVPGDANTRDSCVDDAIQADDPDFISAVTKICKLCSPGGDCSSGSYPPQFFSSAARTNFLQCLGLATACSSATTCLKAMLDTVPSFLPACR